MTFAQLPIASKCKHKEVVSRIVSSISILILQTECSAFLDCIRVHSQPLVSTEVNVIYRSQSMLVQFSCCNSLPYKAYFPDLKSIKLRKIDTEELAHHKLEVFRGVKQDVPYPFLSS